MLVNCKAHLVCHDTQNAQAALGERPADEAEAHAWDLSMHTVDAQAEQASAQDFVDEGTRNAYIRYMQREHLLHVRNQLATGVTQTYAGVTKAHMSILTPKRNSYHMHRDHEQKKCSPSNELQCAFLQ